MAYEKHHQYSIFEWMLKCNLDPDHELIRLAEKIDWDTIRTRLSKYYSRIGRKGKRVRLMVGLHILKHMRDLSDEETTKGLHENIYWMAFCGVPMEDVAASRPLKWVDPSTMTRFRERIGAEGFKEIEARTRELLISGKRINRRTCITDTTCMEKNVAYPTDTGLLNRGRMRVVQIINRLKASGVNINGYVRSFARVGKKALVEANKFGRNKAERVQGSLKRLVDYAERTIKEVPRVIKQTTDRVVKETDEGVRRRIARLSSELTTYSERLKIIVRQSNARLSGNHAPNKLYSLHEPEVVCIKKGKRKKPNEYGCKVSLQVDKNYYIVGHKEYADNRHDSATLGDCIENWEEAFDRPPDGLAGDRGFHKGNEVTPGVSVVGKVAIPRTGKRKGPDEGRPWFKRMQRARAGIEAVISHLKQDHRMKRSRYKGFGGDRINVSLAVVAWNLKKWAADTS